MEALKECPLCEGDGWDADAHVWDESAQEWGQECPACHGTGRAEKEGV